MRLVKFMLEFASLTDKEFLAQFPHAFLLEEGQILATKDTPPRARHVHILDRRMTMGRVLESDIHLNDPRVSGRHAVLQRHPTGGWGVMDVGSSNGTFLDGRRIGAGQLQLLADQSTVRFGSVFSFTFLLPQTFLALLRRVEVRGTEVSDGMTDTACDDPPVLHDPRITTLGASDRGTEGNLAETPLLDILQDVEANHKTGVIYVDGATVRGRISFRAGLPCQAEAEGGLRSAKAVRRLLAEREGEFELIWDESLVGPREMMFNFADLLLSTARHESRLAKEESEERMRATLDSVLHGIITMDPAGKIHTVNPAAERMFGYESGALVGTSVAELLPYPLSEKAVSALLGEGALGVVREIPGKRRDGTVFQMETAASLSTVRGGSQRVAILALRDITERKQAEEELRQSQESLQQAQKMDAIGRMAGGITHDFNNLLSVINGYTGMLLAGDLPPDRQRRYLQAIRQAGDRAAVLTTKLLALCRKQVLSPEVLEVNGVIREFGQLLRPILGESIRLTLSLDETIDRTLADRSQLERVLMNLAINGRDAMSAGGELTISTKRVTVPPSLSPSSDLVPGAYILLTIRDSGCGMSRETVSRLFEPFFTTKPRGKGTGLGLAVAYGIVKQSGGHMEVVSREGVGTEFRIYLVPLAAGHGVERKVPSPSAKHSRSACSEVVLLVEDEDNLREMVRTMLLERGYRVLTATDGAHALQVMAANPQPIDVLLTDVVMPRLSGPDLAKRLRAVRPDTKVLFMSGYPDQPLGCSGPLLPKPFSARQLTSMLRGVIEGGELALASGAANTRRGA